MEDNTTTQNDNTKSSKIDIGDIFKLAEELANSVSKATGKEGTTDIDSLKDIFKTFEPMLNNICNNKSFATGTNDRKPGDDDTHKTNLTDELPQPSRPIFDFNALLNMITQPPSNNNLQQPSSDSSINSSPNTIPPPNTPVEEVDEKNTVDIDDEYNLYKAIKSDNPILAYQFVNTIFIRNKNVWFESIFGKKTIIEWVCELNAVNILSRVLYDIDYPHIEYHQIDILKHCFQKSIVASMITNSNQINVPRVFTSFAWNMRDRPTIQFENDEDALQYCSYNLKYISPDFVMNLPSSQKKIYLVAAWKHIKGNFPE
jgi:hypothetical protein